MSMSWAEYQRAIIDEPRAGDWLTTRPSGEVVTIARTFPMPIDRAGRRTLELLEMSNGEFWTYGKWADEAEHAMDMGRTLQRDTPVIRMKQFTTAEQAKIRETIDRWETERIAAHITQQAREHQAYTPFERFLLALALALAICLVFVILYFLAAYRIW